ncbi:MAG: GNAT family N-acetyltransferase [Nocardioidaceae bacterium]|nr:GNAT family N-acetyltransferase [Nocardioidaceae bacterium]NUS49824.1 GNAT family N-acetyltransferase [Nocardioidaceae bacterium]
MGPDDLAGLAALFEAYRNTRRCWCMSFCLSRTEFALGWLTGGNRRRFEAATAEGVTMGLLASVSGETVGWCACGPRSRYAGAGAARPQLLREHDPDDDDVVWLVPCLFVRADHRSRGITHTLVRAAVDEARREGAVAVEGWPVTGPERGLADAHLGRESTFASLGFRCVSRPTPSRAIMRLPLVEEP